MTEIVKDKKLCTGCAACVQVCKQDAVKMNADDEGFLFPDINEERCLDCGLCRKTCPINTALDEQQEKGVYACFSNDEDIRRNSSSGGIFSLLAQSVLSRSGVVFGAEFDESFRVRHNYIENIGRLDALRRSKYVQSDVGDTYKKAEKFLDEGRMVLFTGTPCQIAGLKALLKKKYENLLTCDLACHGVPSPKIWGMYLDFIKEKYQDEISAISFRDKSTGWNNSSMRIDFKNGRQYREKVKRETFFIGFGKCIFNRNSCFNCKFRIQNTKADITLADFWGIDKQNDKNFTDNKGVSLVITHTESGEAAMSLLTAGICIKERNLSEVLAGNPRLISSCSLPNGRKSFFNDLKSGFTFDKLGKKYMDNSSIKYKVKCLVKFILNPELIKKVRDFIKT